MLKILNVNNKLIIGKFEEKFVTNGGKKQVIIREPRVIITNQTEKGVGIHLGELLGRPESIEIFSVGLVFMYDNKDPEMKALYIESVSNLVIPTGMPRPTVLDLKKN